MKARQVLMSQLDRSHHLASSGLLAVNSCYRVHRPPQESVIRSMILNWGGGARGGRACRRRNGCYTYHGTSVIYIGSEFPFAFQCGFPIAASACGVACLRRWCSVLRLLSSMVLPKSTGTGVAARELFCHQAVNPNGSDSARAWRYAAMPRANSATRTPPNDSNKPPSCTSRDW